LKSLRRNFNRFCFQNRNKGIPNLMLYIVLGNAVVYLLSMVNQNFVLYDILCFDRKLVLQGQVWRLFTYVFTSFSATSNFLMVAISYLCYYSIGKAIENAWGTFRFNLFYLSGILLMDIFAMAFGGILIQNGIYLVDYSSYYRTMGTSLNLTLFLSYATLYPSTHFLLFFIIPVRAWIFALLDLILTVWEMISLSYPVFAFPHNLFPLVAIANYLLFFGKDVANILPVSWRLNAKRLFKKKGQKKTGTVPFPSAGSYQATVTTPTAVYTHKCAVCGRTDVSNPELEFRYCSRCQGYHCYCEDHINNHEHVE